MPRRDVGDDITSRWTISHDVICASYSSLEWAMARCVVTTRSTKSWFSPASASAQATVENAGLAGFRSQTAWNQTLRVRFSHRQRLQIGTQARLGRDAILARTSNFSRENRDAFTLPELRKWPLHRGLCLMSRVHQPRQGELFRHARRSAQIVRRRRSFSRAHFR